jgi:hypothetical protein
MLADRSSLDKPAVTVCARRSAPFKGKTPDGRGFSPRQQTVRLVGGSGPIPAADSVMLNIEDASNDTAARLFRLLAKPRADLPATLVFASRDPAAGDGVDGYGGRIASVDAILAEGVRIYVKLAPPGRPAPRLSISDGDRFTLDIADKDPRSKAVLTAILGLDVTVYLHSILPLAEAVVREAVRLHTGELILDLHGAVPEERALGGHGDVSLFTALEWEFYRAADRIVCVSQRMADHVRQKYGAPRNPPILAPIAPAGAMDERRPESYRERPRVIYAGGAQSWQRLPDMLDLIAATRPNYDFVIHIHAVAEFVSGLKMRGIDAPAADLVIASASHAAVLDACRQADFGLVLRDDSVVNRVACPTKLVEYMKCGAIPVLDTLAVGDFADLGLAHVKAADLKAGAVPSRDERTEMARTNRAIVEFMVEQSNRGAAELRDILCRRP